MRKDLWFSRFEFYFVISVIGIITLVALQRYLVLVEDTKRFSFEINAKNFSTVVYNYHARWLMSQRKNSEYAPINIDGVDILFSSTGWPIALLEKNPVADVDKKNIDNAVSISSCLSLWRHFLQNPPPISFSGSDAYGTHPYHLTVPESGTCRYQFVDHKEFFIVYKPASGEFVFYKRPSISK
jgi:hypothetical protein